MGKGNRVRTQNADERKAKKEAAIKKAAKERLYQGLTVAVTIVLVVALVFAFVWSAFLKDFLGSRSVHSAITMKTENYEVSAAQFNYLYMSTYMSYSSYASYFGFSAETPLEDQAYTNSDIEGYTWHDYFVDETKTAVRELLVLCEAAKVRGITLDEEEKQYIEDNITQLKDAAKEQNISFEKLMNTYYGDYINESDVRSCMEMQTLAGKAAEEIEAEPTYTAEQLKTEVDNNVDKYNFADYRSIKIEADYATGASNDAIEQAKAEAKAYAEKIKEASTDEEGFIKAVTDYYKEIYNVVADDAEETEESDETTDTKEKITETELNEKVEGTLTENHAYSTSDDLGKWLFEQDTDGNYIRKAGESNIIIDSENDTYTVYLIIRPMHINDYATRNVRHILITVDSYDEENGLPDADAKAKADELLAEWKAGDATEDSFGKLAIEHSMDGDPSNGGLYEDVAKGDMVEEFEEWLFDSSRATGDTGIVKTSYGYHVMYYVGESETLKWQADAEANLRAADYEVAYEKFTGQFPVTIDDAAFDKVKQAGT